TAWSATERVDGITGEAVTRAPRRHAAAIDHAQSVLGGHPYAPFVQCQRADVDAGQPLRRGDNVDAAWTPPCDARPAQPDPNRPVGVLEDGARVIVREVVCHGRESHAVETRKSGPRRDPEIPVSRLDDA